MKLKGHKVQDPNSAIAATESLFEFKKEFSKGQGKKGKTTQEDGDGEGDMGNSPKRD